MVVFPPSFILNEHALYKQAHLGDIASWFWATSIKQWESHDESRNCVLNLAIFYNKLSGTHSKAKYMNNSKLRSHNIKSLWVYSKLMNIIYSIYIYIYQ